MHRNRVNDVNLLELSPQLRRCALICAMGKVEDYIICQL